MSLLLRVGHMNVYRERNGVRFTLAVKDSSVILTPSEVHALTAVLVSLFRKQGQKPASGE